MDVNIYNRIVIGTWCYLFGFIIEKIMYFWFPFIISISTAVPVTKLDTYDQSIASTKTKYIKLNNKTQIFFLSFKWKFDDLLKHFDRGNKKTKGEKKFLF